MAHPKRHTRRPAAHAARRTLTARAPRADLPEKYKGIDLRPPDAARSEAKRGLAWREEHGRGGTAIGVARARDIANGRRLSPETVRRMKAYFDRHEGDRKGKGWARGSDGYPSAGRIAWALWGGDAGRGWAAKIVRSLDAADEKALHALAARLHGRPMSLRRDVFRAAASCEAFALDRRLFGDMARAADLGFDVPQPVNAQADAESGIAVIDVCGPLEHHASWWHSYDEILRQVQDAAAASEVKAIVLRFDSPGGVVSGCFEAHRALRRIRKASGKPLVAWIDEMACSAAFELAAACDEIWTPPSGQLGSVGVILGAWDTTEALKSQGVTARYWITGARKADLHPGNPIDDAVSEAAQKRVDDLGAIFFRHVARGRRLSLPLPAEIGDASVHLGADAVRVGLADAVATWPEFLSHVLRLTSATVGTTGAASGTRGRESAGARSTMKDTLIKERDRAAAAMATAKTAEARTVATHAYLAAVQALASLDGTPGAAGGGRMVEEKTTTKKYSAEEAEEDEEAEDDAEEEEAEEGDEEEAEDDADEEAMDSSTDAPDAEDDADEKAIKAAYGAGTRHLHKATGTNGTSADLYSPSNLVRAVGELVQRATGKPAPKGIKGLFGALEGLGKSIRATAKLGAKVEKLEKSDRASRVERLITRGREKGKIAGKKHAASLRADGMAHGPAWLKAHLEAAPVVARTKAIAPREGTEGGGAGGHVGLTGASSESSKIIAQLKAGMTPEAAAAFDAQLLLDAQRLGNRGTPSH